MSNFLEEYHAGCAKMPVVSILGRDEEPETPDLRAECIEALAGESVPDDVLSKVMAYNDFLESE